MSKERRNSSSTRRAPLLAALLGMAACAGGADVTDRVVPLVRGGATGSALVRADVDDRRSGPPALGFEIDCSALPYAEGGQRAFCSEWGRWSVLRHGRGTIVACSCGEFGGFVSWYDAAGVLRQTLVAGDVPQTLIADRDSLLCVTGVTHLNASEGALRAFRLVGDRWQAAGTTPLPRQAESVEIEPDGSLWIRLGADGGALRYRAGVVDRAPPPAPADEVP